MDEESPSDSNEYCISSPIASSKWDRCMKRKAEQVEELGRRRGVMDDPDCFLASRIEMENECMVLREMVNSQQLQIQELCIELDEERNASSSAANEAMSLILRLQQEKAEVQMEAVQFKRFAKEKMAHDEKEMLSMEDLLNKKDELIELLNYEIEAYKHRLLSFEFDQDAKLNEGSFAGGHDRNLNAGEKQDNADLQEPEESNRSVYSEDTPMHWQTPNPSGYPPLRCSVSATEEFSEDDDPLDLEKYGLGETPRDGQQFQNFKHSKEVDAPPRRSKHDSSLSEDSTSTCSVLMKEEYRECILENMFTSGPSESSKRLEEFSTTDHDYCCSTNWANSSVCAAYDTSDVIDALDSIHGAGGSRKASVENEVWEGEPSPYRKKVDGASYYTSGGSFSILRPDNCARDCKTQFGKPREDITIHRGSSNRSNVGDGDIAKKLYSSLQTLEADVESMRQIIMSMQVDNS